VDELFEQGRRAWLMEKSRMLTTAASLKGFFICSFPQRNLIQGKSVLIFLLSEFIRIYIYSNLNKILCKFHTHLRTVTE